MLSAVLVDEGSLSPEPRAIGTPLGVRDQASFPSLREIIYPDQQSHFTCECDCCSSAAPAPQEAVRVHKFGPGIGEELTRCRERHTSKSGRETTSRRSQRSVRRGRGKLPASERKNEREIPKHSAAELRKLLAMEFLLARTVELIAKSGCAANVAELEGELTRPNAAELLKRQFDSFQTAVKVGYSLRGRRTSHWLPSFFTPDAVGTFELHGPGVGLLERQPEPRYIPAVFSVLGYEPLECSERRGSM